MNTAELSPRTSMPSRLSLSPRMNETYGLTTPRTQRLGLLTDRRSINFATLTFNSPRVIKADHDIQERYNPRKIKRLHTEKSKTMENEVFYTKNRRPVARNILLDRIVPVYK